MIKRINYGLCGLLTLYSCAAMAHQCCYDFKNIELDPYIGIDAQYNRMRFDDNDGARFKKWAPQTNGYVGVQFHPNFAVEVGYESSKRTKNEVTIVTGERFLGRTVDPLENNDKHLLELKSRAFHVNLVGFYPIYKHLDLVGSAGLSWVNLSGYDTVSAIPAPYSADNIGKMYLTKTKSILELGCGIKYMVNDNFGIKTMINWQNRSKLNDFNGGLLANALVAKAKNSFKFALGIIFYPMTY